jgi:hypothetical protein
MEACASHSSVSMRWRVVYLKVTDELGWTWKGSGRGLIEVLSWHLLGGTDENHEDRRIAGVPAEIRTEFVTATPSCKMIIIPSQMKPLSIFTICFYGSLADQRHGVFSLLPLFKIIKGGLWDHLALCLSIRLCLAPNCWSFWGLWDHLVVCLYILPNFYYEAYEITLLSTCVSSQFFIRRLMRPLCSLSVYPSVCPPVCVAPLIVEAFEAYEITLLSVCVSSLIFVKRFMRSPFWLCVHVLPDVFAFCAVGVISKESRRLLLSRSSGF